MTAIDLVLILLFGWACFALGRMFQTAIMIRRLLSRQEEIQQLLTQLENTVNDPEEVEVRAEWINGQVYLYTVADNRFLAQGHTVDQAMSMIPEATSQCAYVLRNSSAKDSTATQP